MSTPSTRRGRRTTAILALAAATLAPGLAQIPALADTATRPMASADPAIDPDDLVTIGDAVSGPADIDTTGSVLPTAAQRAAASRLPALDVRWNGYGTPSSLLPRSGALAKATSTKPVTAARAWLRANAAVFGLSGSAMDSLELVNDQELASYPDADGKAQAPAGHAVLFRQSFDGLTPAVGGLVTVGVANGEITYVSSSLARTTAAPAAGTRMSPLMGYLKAAANVGRKVDAVDISKIRSEQSDGWTRLVVPGIAQEQQARPRAFVTADGAVRPAIEANVVDVQGGSSLAHTVVVDALDGSVLYRHNQVDNDMYNNVFSGSVTANSCGPKHPFELTDDLTRTIAAAAIALPADDITIKVFDPDNNLLFNQDLLTSPEATVYTSPTALKAGVYNAQVCPFDSASVVVGQYALAISTSDSAGPDTGSSGFDPQWNYFPAAPSLKSTYSDAVPTNNEIGCWVKGPDCTTPSGPFENLANTGPWDTLASGTAPTMTTVGNNANTHEAWGSPLTPGGLAQAPYSPTREYTAEFTDAWNNSKCDPTNLVPGGNDIDFSVGNLFVSHNRMHDYSYFLGFTEKNYNLQAENYGRGGAGGDQEVGNVQAGALTGGQPLLLGRDNANQIALQDGIPGITNQYLFQPIAGAFYAPCTDGALDMGIVGHEYTHAISNRMVGGPDEGLTSEQGGAMGESWSDQVAAEYMFSHGYPTDGNRWAVGVYATGNKKVAIRDYALNKNPLNYSNYGFDTPGPEVHADGEIWNGTQWSVRQALVGKYNRQYPYNDKRLQLRCAQPGASTSPRPPQLCPGNRRWVQLVFDSFLLQQGATSMLDARDAMIAADRMRFGGKDQAVMWKAFAQRGMGQGASVKNADDTNPTPSFATPRGKNGKVTFKTRYPGQVFVGHYEARVTPIADTIATSKLKPTAQFAPGTYKMLFASKKGGFERFTMTVKGGQSKTVRVKNRKNYAAAANGAKVIGSTDGSINVDSLIDGTEDTNWAGVTEANVDESKPFVAVDLSGAKPRIGRVQVSALLNPVDGDTDPDQDSASRFTALRQFAIEVCRSNCGSASATWKRVLTSKSNAFPAVRPRPVAPDETMRSFRFKRTRAAAVRLVVLNNQCTGFAGYADPKGGELDNDPLNPTDCATGSDRGTIVHAAELQVFGR
ncbi:M36 family metallopeptidase [Nocardioides acrostichi]|uniref:M36 family metallopeptidase n=1 Tax=Nocardioides acrostichi TaxID=2784339 RepID=A0A930V149_9ACTN|nr:M36 family metallopeptidase [Nocardioides acrostichi]MBF4161956.1 M36 family metallopeptidase [Nocardioides acrostichi]